MLFSPLFYLVASLLLSSVDAGKILRRVKERVRDFQLQKNKVVLQNLLGKSHMTLQHVREAWVEQPLDHFNRQEVTTFSQKFFVNDIYWRSPNGPVFLFIGGEGPINEFDVLAGHHVEMAKEHGALLLALEHRFYGDSINPDGLKIESLAHLSSQQALADLASFRSHISRSFNLTRRNTWISFGGSYSGALSAWFRGKFPSLVYAAVASSAPVRAQLDFSAYNKVVGQSLMNEAVGGSKRCLRKVQDAFVAVETRLQRGEVRQVAKDFSCCHVPRNLDDQIELVQSLADVIMGTVQYNEEGVLMSIRDLCRLMTNDTKVEEEAEVEGYKGLVQIMQVYSSGTEERCLDVSREDTLRDLMDTRVHSGRAGRQWTYQTCTEFGFYQTCEDSTCPFSPMITLESQTKLCSMAFGISQHSLQARISFTNSYYGGDQPSTRRVLYVNGGIDPWKELSVLQEQSQEEEEKEARSVFIQDTAHCADMSRGRPSDHPSLRKARQEIERRVADWLRTAAALTLEKKSSLIRSV